MEIPKLMFKNFPKYVGIPLVFACFLTLWGCGNALQNMESSYNEGRFLDTARYAVDGMRNPEYKPKVIEFMSKNGEDILKKVFFKGERLLAQNTGTDSAIQYFDALQQILEEMVTLDIPVANLRTYIQDAEKNKTIAVKKYIEYNYQAGKDAFGRKLYRKADTYFNNVAKYETHYIDTDDYSQKIAVKARRTAVVTPLYKPVNAITQFAGDTLANFITAGKSNAGILADSFIIDGIDVTDTLNSKFMYELNRKKSQYLQCTMSDMPSSISGTHYYVQGIFDGSEIKNKYTTLNNNGKEILNIEYGITLTIKTSIFLAKTREEVKTISFQVESRSLFQFNDNNEGFYSKSAVIQDVLNKAATRLSSEILEVIDRDMDPYAVSSGDAP